MVSRGSSHGCKKSCCMTVVENDPSLLIYDVCRHFPDNFMVWYASLKANLTLCHFINYGLIQEEICNSVF